METSTALAGIKVLDLSRVLAGPFCTQILGDLGADIIKVERPQQGDDTRYWGPPFIADGTAAYYTSANRNKRSLTVDFKTAAGREIIYKLVDQADVLIENFKTGELARFGLDYPTLRAKNPRLIYCSITGFGHTGPRAEEAGYDFLIQAMGGLMSITGPAEGEGFKTGVAVTDLFTGLWATVAILAALQARQQSGLGQQIDLALFDCQLTMLANVASNWFVSQKRPQRYGNAHPNIMPYQTFNAQDGPFALAVGNDRQFQNLCNQLGAPELAAEFSTNKLRIAHRTACTSRLQELFAPRTRAEIIACCQQAQVPAGLINAVDEAFNEPQAQVREMVIEMPSSSGQIPMIGSPLKLTETPVQYRYAPPQLGEHTYEILQELGYSLDQLEHLKENKTI